MLVAEMICELVGMCSGSLPSVNDGTVQDDETRAILHRLLPRKLYSLSCPLCQVIYFLCHALALELMHDYLGG